VSHLRVPELYNKTNLVCSSVAFRVHSSLLGTEQGHTLEFPVDLGGHASGEVALGGMLSLGASLSLGGGVGLEEHTGDQVLVRSLGVLVDHAIVVRLGKREGVVLLVSVSVSGSTSVYVKGEGRNVDDGEGLVELLS